MTIEIEDVKRLHLNPGDVLVVKLSQSADHGYARDILKRIFPDNEVLLADQDVELTVVEKENT
jgi:hypothetical protein